MDMDVRPCKFSELIFHFIDGTYTLLTYLVCVC